MRLAVILLMSSAVLVPGSRLLAQQQAKAPQQRAKAAQQQASASKKRFTTSRFTNQCPNAKNVVHCPRDPSNPSMCYLDVEALSQHVGTDSAIMLFHGDHVTWTHAGGKEFRFSSRFTQVNCDDTPMSSPGSGKPFSKYFDNDQYGLSKEADVDDDAAACTCYKHNIDVKGVGQSDPHVIIEDLSGTQLYLARTQVHKKETKPKH